MLAVLLSHSSRARRLFILAALSLAVLVASAITMGIRVGAVSVLPALLLFVVSGWVISLYDLRHQRVANWLLAPAALSVWTLLLIGTAINSHWNAFGRSLLAGLVVFSALAVLGIVARRGLGFGDVKLGGLVGVVSGYFGWHATWLAVLSAFVLGGLAGCVLLASRNRGHRFAFAPFLIVGAVLAVCWLPAIT